MIQRSIYDALENGLADIAADPTILDDIFEKNLELEAAEVTKIKTLFAQDPPGVQHSYPMENQKFPMFNIVLGSDKESIHVMGDHANDLTEGDDKGVEVQTSIFNQQYIVFVLTEHPLATMYFYETAKYLLQEYRALNDETLHIHLSGSDVRPDKLLVPTNLFVRQLSLDVGYEFVRFNRESKLDKAWRLGGLHIDKSGSPSDVGDVNTNITPYTVEED